METIFLRATMPKNKKPLSMQVKSMYKILSVTLCCLGIAAVLSYLYINSLKSAKGYHYKQLQMDYEDLQAESRSLEKQIIDARSYVELENGDDLDGMETASSDEFTFVEESAVAQKDNEEKNY